MVIFNVDMVEVEVEDLVLETQIKTEETLEPLVVAAAVGLDSLKVLEDLEDREVQFLIDQ